eukprot:CAMPEP_0201907760 /NCGR_PEP_ID=MMETSP0902-20130614/57699_1 /ASSEMBLY_ACC=CAM_ASM_000551 /TAXON_ID=420261 /ORGANISM="Thalassiosira antarctica, Strain CCMP982" /LENGTH=130 /DNA_ID=CAMNT_0048441923 /DNA_START=400 /DNA_END=789 /DNA_ORIENTATION=+
MWAALKEKRRRAQLFCNAIKLQSVFRRHLTILRVIELREFRAMCESQNLMDVENIACLAAQKWWRHVLLQRNLAEDERIIKMIILENKAATAIQSCFRGYQDFVGYLMKNYSTIEIQTQVRGYQARCHLQ